MKTENDIVIEKRIVQIAAETLFDTITEEERVEVQITETGYDKSGSQVTGATTRFTSAEIEAAMETAEKTVVPLIKSLEKPEPDDASAATDPPPAPDAGEPRRGLAYHTPSDAYANAPGMQPAPDAGENLPASTPDPED